MRVAEINYSDIPPLDESFLKEATTAWPPVKQQLTIRVDADVLNWLRGAGQGLSDPHQPDSSRCYGAPAGRPEAAKVGHHDSCHCAKLRFGVKRAATPHRTSRVRRAN